MRRTNVTQEQKEFTVSHSHSLSIINKMFLCINLHSVIDQNGQLKTDIQVLNFISLLLNLHTGMAPGENRRKRKLKNHRVSRERLEAKKNLWIVGREAWIIQQNSLRTASETCMTWNYPASTESISSSAHQSWESLWPAASGEIGITSLSLLVTSFIVSLWLGSWWMHARITSQMTCSSLSLKDCNEESMI